MKHTADPIFAALASGLTQIDWDADRIEQHLRQRLPSRFQSRAPAMARNLRGLFPGATNPDEGRIASALSQGPASRALRRFVQNTGALPEFICAPARFHPLPAFVGCDLPVLTNVSDLADWLSLSDAQLMRFSDLKGLSARTDNAFAPHYRHHLHPKPDGTLRLIEEPKPVLKKLQRRILHGLLSQVPPHDAAYGFRTGRHCAMAAACHAGEAVVLRFDLAAFFPSIAQNRVYGLFRGFGYPAPVARHLTGLCTALTPARVLATPGLAAAAHLSSRHLPQGAPTSPALANLVAFTLDTRLNGLARSLGATYTRYADDLCFSGDDIIVAPLRVAVPEIVDDCGFQLNAAKSRVQPAHHRQTVTGIVVNQHLNMPRRDYDLLKAQIHRLSNPADPRRADPVFLSALEGRIAWLEQLNPQRGMKLREKLSAALT